MKTANPPWWCSLCATRSRRAISTFLVAGTVICADPDPATTTWAWVCPRCDWAPSARWPRR